MQKQFHLFTLGLLLTCLAACVTEPDYPNEPVVEYIGVSKNQVNEFDSLTLSFSFTDGDGDLGRDKSSSDTCNNQCSYIGPNACINNPNFDCFLIDQRDSCYVILKLPDLEPTGDIKAVSGEIDVVVPPVFCKCGAGPCPPTQDLIYEIIVVDFAGNRSNVILSEPITINCN